MAGWLSTDWEPVLPNGEVPPLLRDRGPGIVRLVDGRLAPIRAGARGHWCHYCGFAATTRDHIVPRSRLRGTRLSHMVGDLANFVAACQTCNLAKADLRSDCGCERCVGAWETLGPPGWQDISVVKLVTV